MRKSIPRVPREEALYQNKKTESCGKRAMCRPVQKNVSSTKDLVGKISREGNFMMDFSASMCPTGKVCVLLDQHRTFAGGDLDSEVLGAAEPEPQLTFASQPLNPNYDSTRDEEMKKTAQRLNEKVSVCRNERWKGVAE